MSHLSELFFNLRLVVKENIKHLINYKHNLLLADSPCHDDLYVVSFPKSGATWMNFLMANIHLKMSNDDRKVTFFNVHDFVPDIHSSRNVSSNKSLFPFFRVIKSHAGFNPYYQKVLYLVRDPRDVMVSYYYFLNSLGISIDSISQLIHSKKYGITAWNEHVKGWMEDSPASISLVVLRYEDLKQDAHAELIRIYGHLGYTPNGTIMQQAISCCSFDKMKNMEKKYNYGDRPIANKLNFLRKGMAGGWHQELTDNDTEYIITVAGKWMRHFGYKA